MIPLLYFGLASLGNRQIVKIFCDSTMIGDSLRTVLGHNHGRKSMNHSQNKQIGNLCYRQIFKNSWNCGGMNRKKTSGPEDQRYANVAPFCGENKS